MKEMTVTSCSCYSFVHI